MGKAFGPEINLHALAAMLRGSWLKQVGLAATIVAIVFAALASLALTFFFRGSAKSLAAGVVGGALLWLLLCAAVLWFFRISCRQRLRC